MNKLKHYVNHQFIPKRFIVNEISCKEIESNFLQEIGKGIISRIVNTPKRYVIFEKFIDKNGDIHYLEADLTEEELRKKLQKLSDIDEVTI